MGPHPPRPWRGPPLLDPRVERSPSGKRPGTPSFLVPRRGRTERVLTPLDPDGALPLLDQGERHGTPSFLVRRIKSVRFGFRKRLKTNKNTHPLFLPASSRPRPP